jgi:hypothetical protein
VRPAFRQIVVRALAALLCAPPAASLAVPPDRALEYDVKAAYIFNLSHYTGWPSAAFDTPSAPFRVCVADPDPFGRSLTQTFRDETVEGRAVVVSVVRSKGELRGCHVLFVGQTADASGTLQQAAAGEPILTVGESATFEKRGGIITFVSDAGRIRFDVSQEQASRAGIKLSSKVLQVARKVS